MINHIQEKTKRNNENVILTCLSEGSKTFEELLKCSRDNKGAGSRQGFDSVRNRLVKEKLIEIFFSDTDKKMKYRLTKFGALTYEKLNWPVIDELLDIDREKYYYFEDKDNVFSTSTIYDTSALNSSAFNYLPTFSEIPLFIKQIFGTFLLSGSNIVQSMSDGEEGEVSLFTKINIKKLNEVLSDLKLLIQAEDRIDFLLDKRFKISQISDVREKREKIQFMIDLLVYGSTNLGEDVQNKSLHIIVDTIKNTVDSHVDLFSDLNMDILKAISDDIDLSLDPLNDKTIPHKIFVFRNKENNLIEFPLLNYVIASKLWKLDQNYNEKVKDYLEKYPNGLRWRLERGEIKP